MNKTQLYYGLFGVAVILVLAGGWLRQSAGFAYGLPFIGLCIWLWLRFGDHNWPKKSGE